MANPTSADPRHSSGLRPASSPAGTPVGSAPAAPTSGPRSKKWRWLVIVTVAAVLTIAVVRQLQPGGGASQAGKAGAERGMQGPVPVIAGVVETRDVPIFLDGLGTVQALNTVTVRARVDGEIKNIAFKEGQDVKEGDLLVEIDPAPYRAAFEQAVAKQRQDEAQLANARADLERYTELAAKKVISSQQLDTQRALVRQNEALVKADEAAVASARVQLDYTRIVAPIGGRTGIRQVDIGNIVRASDQAGLVIVTQLQPISLLFTLPEQNLGQIDKERAATGELVVTAVDRDNKTVLEEGRLAVIDNQIDTTTGTIRLKAIFPNARFKLWPGQFVNARLLVDIRRNAVVVRASVVQRGPQGPFAFVIREDRTVEMRPIKVGPIEGGMAIVEEGLKPGEQIVIDGQYKLAPNSRVTIAEPARAGQK